MRGRCSLADFADLGAPLADIDVKDLQSRARGAVDGFRKALLALDEDVDTLDDRRDPGILMTLAGYGVTGAFPISGRRA